MIISLYRILVFDSPGASPPAQGWMLIPSTPQALATPWQLAEHCIVVPGSKGTIQGNPHPCIIRNSVPSIHSDSENKNHRTVWNRGSQLLHFFSFFFVNKNKIRIILHKNRKRIYHGLATRKYNNIFHKFYIFVLSDFPFRFLCLEKHKNFKSTKGYCNLNNTLIR